MPNKLIIIIIGVLLLFTAGTSAGLFVVWNKVSELDGIVNPKPENEASENEEETTQKKQVGPLVPLDAFVVNLSDPGENRFLRLKMSLELTDGDFEKEITRRLPQVRNSILTTLPTKRSNEIQSVEGKIALRNEIMANLNKILEEEAIVNIYFTEFVIQ
jgi:flagellar FliL protein